MIQYIIRRLLILPFVLLLLTMILFLFILRIPAEQRVGVYLPSMRAGLSEEEQTTIVNRTIERYGLNRPIPIQYWSWLRNLTSGDWGFSQSWNQPVLEGLLRRVPATVELVLIAMVPATVLALTLGSYASLHHGRTPDHLVRAAAFLGWALPSFIVGLTLMNLLYAWLGWFPPQRLSAWARPVVEGEAFRNYTGLHTVDALLNANLELFWDAVRHLVLPGVTLAITAWALLVRIMRSSLLEIMQQDYITTARAKGVPESRVVSLHARRNALLPVISTGGVVTSTLISGVVVIETIFDLDGIGRAATEAMLSFDITAIVGFTIFTCLVTLLVTLATDLTYAFVDPRTRLY
jgi:peptide/nickel transport system permease protein